MRWLRQAKTGDFYHWTQNLADRGDMYEVNADEVPASVRGIKPEPKPEVAKVDTSVPPPKK